MTLHSVLGVLTQCHVCDSELGELPGEARGGAWQDGHVGHPLSGPY